MNGYRFEWHMSHRTLRTLARVNGDDASVLAQRDTEPQLSGRRLQAVVGLLEGGMGTGTSTR